MLPFLLWDIEVEWRCNLVSNRFWILLHRGYENKNCNSHHKKMIYDRNSIPNNKVRGSLFEGKYLPAQTSRKKNIEIASVSEKKISYILVHNELLRITRSTILDIFRYIHRIIRTLFFENNFHEICSRKT